jgi:type II restriction enzyme
MAGRDAKLADSRTNRGHDLTVDGVRFSLKTQADKGIREDEIHISKFMELGKGVWSSRATDLAGLREQFMRHLDGYDRILTLRSLPRRPNAAWRYELVEIPRSVLREAADGPLRVCRESTQKPKPGYCDVGDPAGGLKFQLYFDGGTERKLQIKHLRKEFCIVQACWEFVTE